MTAQTPSELSQVAGGTADGRELSAAPLTQITPSEFVLPPASRRNVRVTTHLPHQSADHPNYYADINVRSAYPDGQSAGQTRVSLQLVNPSADEVRDAEIGSVAIEYNDTASAYLVQAEIANTGSVHFYPTVSAEIIDLDGVSIAALDMAGAPGRLLPSASRDFSGELDISDMLEGDYSIRFDAHLGSGNRIRKFKPIRIISDTRNERHEVTLVKRD